MFSIRFHRRIVYFIKLHYNIADPCNTDPSKSEIPDRIILRITLQSQLLIKIFFKSLLNNEGNFINQCFAFIFIVQ